VVWVGHLLSIPLLYRIVLSLFITALTIFISLYGLRLLYWMQVELQYRQDYAAITGTIGLKPSPIVEATGVVGSNGFAVGGELAFDTASGNLTKYNAALNYIQPGFNGSLIL
jgi:hypothetical protein